MDSKVRSVRRCRYTPKLLKERRKSSTREETKQHRNTKQHYACMYHWKDDHRDMQKSSWQRYSRCFLATQPTLKRCLLTLGVHIGTKIFQEFYLSYSSFVSGWWCPPQKTLLFYHQNNLASHTDTRNIPRASCNNKNIIFLFYKCGAEGEQWKRPLGESK